MHVLHLQLFSVYVLMQTEMTEQGDRVGELRAGTREFADLVGHVSEKWIVDTTGADDAPAGRIELRSSFVSTSEDIE